MITLVSEIIHVIIMVIKQGNIAQQMVWSVITRWPEKASYLAGLFAWFTVQASYPTAIQKLVICGLRFGLLSFKGGTVTGLQAGLLLH